MNPKPVLRAIRSILQFKDDTTIAEIASISGLKRSRVLDVVNDNAHLLTINRTNGKIINEKCREAMLLKLYGDGKIVYRQDQNYGAEHALNFAGHEEFRAAHTIDSWEGGFGDCRAIRYVPDTPENRAILESEGCLNNEYYTRATVDGSELWKEKE